MRASNDPYRSRTPPPTQILTRVKYIIDMGWPRWGARAQLVWLAKLADVCQETINECAWESERILARMEERDDD